jgi:hypothetical protein
VKRRVLFVVGFIIVFVVGIAIGEALHDNPSPGGQQTIVRTLNPLPLLPARETVTVTTTAH